MEAGDLHDPGRLYRQEHDGAEPIAPEQAGAQMRGAVERLRRQLQAGLLAELGMPPDVEADDQDSGD